MLKRFSYSIKRLLMLVDVGLILFAYWASSAIRFGLSGLSPVDLRWILLISCLVIPMSFSFYGIYDFQYKTPWQCINRVFLAHLINLMVITSMAYLWRIHHFSRLFMIIFIAIALCFHLSSRVFIGKLLQKLRSKGYNYRRTLVVGLSDTSERIISSIEKNIHWGIRIDGLIKEDESNTHPGEIFKKYPQIGYLHNLKSILMKNAVDNVIFCTQRKNIADLKNIILDIEAMGISSHVAISNPAIRISNTFLGNIDGIPLITYCPVKLDNFDLLLKNLIDFFGGVIGFIIFLILYPVVGLAIKFESKGPILFTQKRMGENGRIFTLYKFRSMYNDAERKKQDLLQQNELKGAVFKISEDPRITKVGKLLRKFSLDEWPQFINVLKGEMSMVGTRPPTLDEVEQYDLWHKRRLSMKPGLTGLWQVSGRNAITDFNEIVKLDLKYIDNWSIWYDLYIIFKTFLVALRREGAY